MPRRSIDFVNAEMQKSEIVCAAIKSEFLLQEQTRAHTVLNGEI